MSLNRNVFLDSFVKDSAKLHNLFLNHSGAPAKLHTDLQSIDLLADREGIRNFFDYCSSSPLVREIILTHRYMRSKVLISFHDGSQLNIKLIRKMVRQSLNCLSLEVISKESFVNDYGMLVPSNKHHFEYILLKYQIAESPFPDKFQKYFSALDSKSRVEIFSYIQTKYNIVFNVLEDLYQPKGGVRLKLIIGLRHQKSNTLYKMAYRSLQTGILNLFYLFAGKTIIIPTAITTSPVSGESAGKEAKKRALN